MKILILVPIWKRPEITKIWVEGMKYFLTPNISVLAILSNEDPNYNDNIEIIKDEFNYCFYDNNPLGKKLNAGIEYALDNFEFDYLMNLGSDDIIHPGIWSLYDQYFKVGNKFFGLDVVYFYDKISSKLACSTPYLWGAGRVIHREILEKIRIKGDFLYKNEFSQGLDCNSIEKVKFLLNIEYKQVETNDFPYLVDIKSEIGISDFTLLSRFYNIVDFNILNQYYPKHILKLL
jgi:hypothetical protein